MGDADQLPAGGCVPKVSVIAVVGCNAHRCRQAGPIRTERHGFDRAVVRQARDLGPGGHFPDARRLVQTAGRNVPAVGTECDRLDDMVVLQRRDLMTRGDLSHLGCLPADCRYLFSVGADYNRRDPPTPAERKKEPWEERNPLTQALLSFR